MKIKAMIAEDERLVREELAYLIQHEEDFILCPSAENGQQLLELNDKYQPDVIFLDIHMPGLSGIKVAEKIKADNPNAPLIVFTTAYDEYALQAFDLEAVDYLLKPYDTGRFKEAINRIRKKFALEAKPFSVPDAKRSQPSKLLIEDGEKVVVVNPHSIYYVVRAERYLEIHTDQEIMQTKMTLQELEEKLRDLPFFRSHRSYLVNIEYIQEIVPWFNGAYNLILKNKEKTKIPVSRSSAKHLFEIFQR
ncbi:LytTR family DNA-binding domain-containing protein [Microaerobacter geothermalis]|uniref:LytR/AlgR family response regulator transcription factor n=1 Tax=Microaerobacter geothermalis TaxID=674972 RepID=UPI001F469199|nr:LytTR family DNA-binding domain-containing protein [Microaerobacter geothermalis]MCF6094976.1 LytTR family DNA-binding domain-containing protein [Microaerobacter geothermalis]